jgi:hypothetical protein
LQKYSRDVAGRMDNCSATPDRYEQMMHSCPSCR